MVDNDNNYYNPSSLMREDIDRSIVNHFGHYMNAINISYNALIKNIKSVGIKCMSFSNIGVIYVYINVLLLLLYHMNIKGLIV